MEEEKKNSFAAIIKTALKLFAEKGFRGTTIEMISEKAGVGISYIYRKFRNKDEFVWEIYKDIEGRLKPLVVESHLDDTSPRDRFIYTYTRIYLYLLKNPVEFKFLSRFYNSPYGVAYRKKRLASPREDIFIDLFEYGLSKKAIMALPMEAIYSVVFGPLEFIIRSHNAGFIQLDEKMIRKLLEASWNALKQ